MRCNKIHETLVDITSVDTEHKPSFATLFINIDKQVAEDAVFLYNCINQQHTQYT